VLFAASHFACDRLSRDDGVNARLLLRLSNINRSAQQQKRSDDCASQNPTARFKGLDCFPHISDPEL